MIDCSRDDQLVDSVHKKGVDLLPQGVESIIKGIKFNHTGVNMNPFFMKVEPKVVN